MENQRIPARLEIDVVKGSDVQKRFGLPQTELGPLQAIRVFDPDTDRDTYPDGMVPNIGPSGFRQAFATKCTQCHTQVHGSDLPSQTVPGLGGGLTR